MSPAASDVVAAAQRLRADAETVAAAAERLAELQTTCGRAHAWLEDNRLGDLPGLEALLAQLRAALGEA